MPDLNLVAPCGLDCANCELFIPNNRTDVWQRAAARLNKKPEDVACKGCRANNGCTVHMDCATLACVAKKGLIFCSECEEFPCSRLMPAADGARFYPHNYKLYNLCRIRLLGLERFLEEAPIIRKRYFHGKFVVGLGPQDPQ